VRTLFYWHSEGLVASEVDSEVVVQSANLIDFMMVVAERCESTIIGGPLIKPSSTIKMQKTSQISTTTAQLSNQGRLSFLFSLPAFVWSIAFGNTSTALRESDISVSIGLSSTGTIVGLVRCLLVKKPHAFIIRGNRRLTVSTSSRNRLNKLFMLMRIGLYEKILRALVTSKGAEIWFQGRAQHATMAEELGAEHAQKLYVLDAVLRSLPNIQVSSTKKVDLVYVGRLTKEKGLVELVSALGQLSKSDQKISLRIIGKGPDEALIRQKAIDAGIDSQIEWVGFLTNTSEIAQQVSEAKVFVLPSYTEGLPRSLLEAMYLNVLCLATPVGGIPYIFTDRENIIFVPVRDVKSLAQALSDTVNNYGNKHMLELVEHARQIALSCSFESRAFVFTEKACRER